MSLSTSSKNIAIIITGVSGSGKTTIGKELGAATGIEFLDADDFHPAENVDKMSKGVPLTDENRFPWLMALNQFIKERLESVSLILACSALKESYRSLLVKGLAESHFQFIHLTGDFEVIKNRIKGRKEHYMPVSLLQSQYETFEKPVYGICVDVNQPIVEIVNFILKHLNMQRSEIGLVGLGVMGTSLARNIAGKGFSLSIFNRHVDNKEVDVAIQAKRDFTELSNALAFDDLKAFAASLNRPRKILLMVNAGKAVDEVIQQLIPFLDKGDLLIDGGNSHFEDTEARIKKLEGEGVHFLGCGISGGEEGALHGPAIMPGGNPEAFRMIEHVLTTIAAKNNNHEVCCAYVGDGGAGHFVKMVHNGIEYAEMQMIAEVYSLLRAQGNTLEEISSLMKQWNKGINQCYLLEITADILLAKDIDNEPLIDKILDKTGNKGTGSWTTISACQLGVPIPTLTEALFARYSSSMAELRATLSGKFGKIESTLEFPLPQELEQGLFFARIMNHIQGLLLISEASSKFKWSIDLNSLLSIWTGGCIIRSELINMLRKLDFNNAEQHLFTDSVISELEQNYASFRKVCIFMAASPMPFPCFSASNEFFKYISTARTNAYLLQAQRDYFGAHTFQRIDDQSGKSYHHKW